ncbi:unnamed protein product [Allacma fusca]|uniref:Uncharacterized protein n=1 Tax=Allacma fusca TaxID=39272 RepID=A0A8J2LIC0_9HEXA|nr:unnamed protein product [Allacma fusca]
MIVPGLLPTSDPMTPDYFGTHQASYHHMTPASPTHHVHGHAHHQHSAAAAAQFYHSSYYNNATTYATPTIMSSHYIATSNHTVGASVSNGSHSSVSSSALYTGQLNPSTIPIVDKSDLTITMYTPNVPSTASSTSNSSSINNSVASIAQAAITAGNGMLSTPGPLVLLDHRAGSLNTHHHQLHHQQLLHSNGADPDQEASEQNSMSSSNSTHLNHVGTMGTGGSNGHGISHDSVARAASGTGDSLGVWRPY